MKEKQECGSTQDPWNVELDEEFSVPANSRRLERKIMAGRSLHTSFHAKSSIKGPSSFVLSETKVVWAFTPKESSK